MSNRLPSDPKPTDPGSLRVDAGGRWFLHPSGRVVAEPGEWFTFLPLMPLELMGFYVVYGKVVGVAGAVSVDAVEQPAGMAPQLFAPYLLAEVRVRADGDGAGGVVVTIAEAPGGALDQRGPK